MLQPFQQQRHGTRLCGFYAMAACVSCTLGQNPSGSIFTEELLFPHYTELVDFNHVQLFDSRLSDDCVNPKTVHAAKLHCMCQMPSSASRQMVQYDQCQSWYHPHAEVCSTTGISWHSSNIALTGATLPLALTVFHSANDM